MVVWRVRRLALGILPVLFLVGFTTLPAQAAYPPINGYLGIDEYAATSTSPFQIIAGPDNKVWYTSDADAPAGDAVVQVEPATGATLNTYSTSDLGLPCLPSAITIGPDRFFWIACSGALNSLIRMNPADGTKTAFGPYWPSGQGPLFMTSGLDGNLWFPEANFIAKFNVTNHGIVRYPLPGTSSSRALGLVSGPDGRLWYTETSRNKIGRITTAGVITEFAIPSASSFPYGITPGPDGNLYFTEYLVNKIGRITPAGAITEINVPTGGSGPSIINVGPDGNLWFAETQASKIASMTPAGVFSETATTTTGALPFGIGTGPDGNVWFTETSTDKIGKIGARHTVLSLDKTGVGIGNLDYGGTTGPGFVLSSALTNHGADSLPAFTPVIGAGGSGQPSGNFTLNGQSCSGAPIAASGACTADAGFTATSTAGSSVGRMDFPTDAGTAYAQKLSVGVSATVRTPACSSAYFFSPPPSPVTVGGPMHFQAFANCPHSSPLFSFRWQSPHSHTWAIPPFTTSNTFDWNTTGFSPGTYLMRVLVKDALSTTTSYDAWALTSVTLVWPKCAATNVTPNTPSPVAPGATITFTAQIPGCFSALFNWWILKPGTTVWTSVPGHGYSNSNSQFAWNTTGLPLGTYQIGVWVKDPASILGYDAYSYVTYTLVVASGSTHCQAANIDVSPGSPSLAGTSITLTASVTSCNNPQYRWWVRDPAAVWHMVKDFSTTNPYTWTPTSPGTYLVGAWARQIGSTTAHEAYSFVTYTVTIKSCVAVNLGGYGPPVTPGTTVHFNAASSGCDTPNYQFYIAAPGGSYVQKQVYGAGNTFDWVTTGLPQGVYQVAVVARQAGSTASYQAAAYASQQLQVGGATCDNVSMFPTNQNTVNDSSSQSPKPAGTQLTWNAAAPGCTGEYQFYLQSPGNYYHIVQAYSATATWAWNTAGLPRGTYNIRVLVRRAGTTVSYENFASSSYELV